MKYIFSIIGALALLGGAGCVFRDQGNRGGYPEHGGYSDHGEYREHRAYREHPIYQERDGNPNRFPEYRDR